MLTEDISLQYAGERRGEDHWGPPELQMRHIFQTRDRKKYRVYIEISFASRRYIFRHHKRKYSTRCERVEELKNNTNRQKYKQYIALYKKIE